MTTGAAKIKRGPDYHFHPSEIAFVGFSGSGKTTLIEKLVGHWDEWDVGYLKHDAHGFAMDREGKDTDRLRRAGASTVIINDQGQTAVLAAGEMELGDRCQFYRGLLNAKDFVVVEGYKDLAMPQVVVLDSQLRILERLSGTENFQKRLYVGESASTPSPELQPYYQRDDVAGISSAILEHFRQRHRERPLYGLILGGGRSQRMGQDKGLLKYGERSQIEVCRDLLAVHCSKTFLSGRVGQWPETVVPEVPRIYDSFLDMGPLGGILSAMKEQPQAAWLVLAVDLPRLSAAAVDHLVKQRNPFKFATLYGADRSTGGKHPVEPLCAIYEPKGYGKFLEQIANDRNCPSAILGRLPVEKLAALATQDLTNINHPEERRLVLEELARATEVRPVAGRHYEALTNPQVIQEKTL